MGVKNIAVMGVVCLCFLMMGYSLGAGMPATVLPHASGSAVERASPSNWIEQEQIHLYRDKVVIEMQDPQWAVFADSNSMDPFIDTGAHALQVVPQSEDDLAVGDVISFSRAGESKVIIHRIYEIGHDQDGWFATTKGDNNYAIDEGKVRFSQIHRVLVGVLY